ncbi:MAG: CDP-6-deoxy-delta-3,4-glucoseen reductase [Gammaproteobacteria bacterium]|jgi:CDP-4-dehydro-6-deoxyglucose reductase|nr:CDP-6-deoxy-delta-3,4-glucoseen reductase [Gammaproteobacteria bacterium]
MPTVHAEPSGHQFEVQPGESILSAALRQGVALPYGCRNGQCGSCNATLLSGSVDYPEGLPPALEGAPADACTCCRAVPRTDLRLRVREVERVADIEVRLLPCRVQRIEPLAHDVVRLWLKLPEGDRLQFLAGQYLEFVLPDGRQRAFSIANAPHDDALLELHVRHVPGGGFTGFVFDQLKEKAILRIRAPLGTFVLREASARPILFVAGGTGLAPVKGMIEHALHVGLSRPMTLYWGVRSRRDLYLPELPRAWERARPDFRYVPVLSEPDPDWTGRTGFVHAAVVADHPALDPFEVYMAGPPPMVAAAREAFTRGGLALEHLHSDAFEFAKDPARSG